MIKALLLLLQRLHSRQPVLRHLETLGVIAGEKSSTIVFPFPVEAGKFLAELGGAK